MSDSATNADRLFQLAGAVFDKDSSDRDCVELNSILLADEGERRRFLQYCKMHMALRVDLRARRAIQNADQQINIAPSALALPESPVAAGGEAPPTIPANLLSTTFPGTPGYFSSGWPVAYLVATVIFGVALVIGAITHVSHPGQIVRQSVPSPQPLASSPSVVGRITGMVDCRWESSGFRGQGSAISGQQLQSTSHYPLATNHSVALGDRFALSSGLLEITYDTGAKVILQGPVTYEVESSTGGYLSVGKLTAKLEKKVASSQWSVANESKVPGPSLTTSHQPLATSSNPQSIIPNPSLSPVPCPLFSVRTPTAVVTDLGTEFGVEVDKQGDTTSHVFRGSVRLQVTGSDPGKEGSMLVLHENETARAEKANGLGIVGHRVSAKPQTFVRQIAQPIKSLDVLDIVAGGDGLGHRRDRGIDPSTAMEEPVFTPGRRDVERGYHRITTYRHKLLDGVFFADGSQGAVELDSAGHNFIGFPKAGGASWGPFWARPAMIPAARLERAKEAHQFVDCIDDSDRFTPQGRGLLCLAPYMGITFDIKAMRKTQPDVRPARFRAIAGVGNVSVANLPDESRGDFWVFIDGQLKLKRMQIGPQDSVVQVDVEVGPDDRFLTLVNTDSANEKGCGYVVFGDPVLDMVPVEGGHL